MSYLRTAGATLLRLMQLCMQIGQKSNAIP